MLQQSYRPIQQSHSSEEDVFETHLPASLRRKYVARCRQAIRRYEHLRVGFPRIAVFFYWLERIAEKRQAVTEQEAKRQEYVNYCRQVVEHHTVECTQKLGFRWWLKLLGWFRSIPKKNETVRLYDQITASRATMMHTPPLFMAPVPVSPVAASSVSNAAAAEVSEGPAVADLNNSTTPAATNIDIPDRQELQRPDPHLWMVSFEKRLKDFVYQPKGSVKALIGEFFHKTESAIKSDFEASEVVEFITPVDVFLLEMEQIGTQIAQVAKTLPQLTNRLQRLAGYSKENFLALLPELSQLAETVGHLQLKNWRSEEARSLLTGLSDLVIKKYQQFCDQRLIFFEAIFNYSLRIHWLPRALTNLTQYMEDFLQSREERSFSFFQSATMQELKKVTAYTAVYPTLAATLKGVNVFWHLEQLPQTWFTTLHQFEQSCLQYESLLESLKRLPQKYPIKNSLMNTLKKIRAEDWIQWWQMVQKLNADLDALVCPLMIPYVLTFHVGKEGSRVPSATEVQNDEYYASLSPKEYAVFFIPTTSKDRELSYAERKGRWYLVRRLSAAATAESTEARRYEILTDDSELPEFTQACQLSFGNRNNDPYYDSRLGKQTTGAESTSLLFFLLQKRGINPFKNSSSGRMLPMALSVALFPFYRRWISLRQQVSNLDFYGIRRYHQLRQQLLLTCFGSQSHFSNLFPQKKPFSLEENPLWQLVPCFARSEVTHPAEGSEAEALWMRKLKEQAKCWVSFAEQFKEQKQCFRTLKKKPLKALLDDSFLSLLPIWKMFFEAASILDVKKNPSEEPPYFFAEARAYLDQEYQQFLRDDVRAVEDRLCQVVMRALQSHQQQPQEVLTYQVEKLLHEDAVPRVNFPLNLTYWNQAFKAYTPFFPLLIEALQSLDQYCLANEPITEQLSELLPSLKHFAQKSESCLARLQELKAIFKTQCRPNGSVQPFAKIDTQAVIAWWKDVQDIQSEWDAAVCPITLAYQLTFQALSPFEQGWMGKDLAEQVHSFLPENCYALFFDPKDNQYERPYGERTGTWHVVYRPRQPDQHQELGRFGCVFKGKETYPDLPAVCQASFRYRGQHSYYHHSLEDRTDPAEALEVLAYLTQQEQRPLFKIGDKLLPQMLGQALLPFYRRALATSNLLLDLRFSIVLLFNEARREVNFLLNYSPFISKDKAKQEWVEQLRKKIQTEGFLQKLERPWSIVNNFTLRSRPKEVAEIIAQPAPIVALVPYQAGAGASEPNASSFILNDVSPLRQLYLRFLFSKAIFTERTSYFYRAVMFVAEKTLDRDRMDLWAWLKDIPNDADFKYAWKQVKEQYKELMNTYHTDKEEGATESIKNCWIPYQEDPAYQALVKKVDDAVKEIISTMHEIRSFSFDDPSYLLLYLMNQKIFCFMNAFYVGHRFGYDLAVVGQTMACSEYSTVWSEGKEERKKQEEHEKFKEYALQHLAQTKENLVSWRQKQRQKYLVEYRNWFFGKADKIDVLKKGEYLVQTGDMLEREALEALECVKIPFFDSWQSCELFCAVFSSWVKKVDAINDQLYTLIQAEKDATLEEKDQKLKEKDQRLVQLEAEKQEAIDREAVLKKRIEELEGGHQCAPTETNATNLRALVLQRGSEIFYPAVVSEVLPPAEEVLPSEPTAVSSVSTGVEVVTVVAEYFNLA